MFDVTLLKPLGLTPKNFPNRPGVGIAKIKEGAGCLTQVEEELRQFLTGPMAQMAAVSFFIQDSDCSV